VQDLTISLIGPPEIGSPEVFLTREACGEFDDIDAVFDDSGNSIQCANTSPSIRGTVTAVGQLSNFNGLAANGIWRIRVQDPHDADGGAIVSASLQFCRVTPSTLLNEDFETNEFTIFPNPTNGIVNIRLQKNSETESVVNVIDVQGRDIMKSTLDAQETKIDLSNFQKGIYFVKVTNGNKQTTKKIILQ
jgi:subtilisin-like proprotein convertase family protein